MGGSGIMHGARKREAPAISEVPGLWPFDTEMSLIGTGLYARASARAAIPRRCRPHRCQLGVYITPRVSSRARDRDAAQLTQLNRCAASPGRKSAQLRTRTRVLENSRRLSRSCEQILPLQRHVQQLTFLRKRFCWEGRWEGRRARLAKARIDVDVTVRSASGFFDATVILLVLYHTVR